jgi:hypothetical protein
VGGSGYVCIVRVGVGLRYPWMPACLDAMFWSREPPLNIHVVGASHPYPFTTTAFRAEWKLISYGVFIALNTSTPRSLGLYRTCSCLFKASRSPQHPLCLQLCIQSPYTISSSLIQGRVSRRGVYRMFITERGNHPPLCPHQLLGNHTP